MARRVEIVIAGDATSAQRAFAATEASAKGLGAAVGTLRVGFATLAKSYIFIELLNKAMEGLTETVHIGIEEFKDNAKIQAQTAAAIKSTGGVAHVTAKQVDELGLSLSNLSGVDDELIRQGENTLLAFQNIRNFAGRGNQIFTEATRASLDFAVRSGRSVQAAAVAVGRALQDPAKAAGSLRRAYVVLTDAEKKAINAAVNHGDSLKAQRLIIADLEKRYGGAAAAAGKTLPGALSILRERFKDLAGAGIARVAPALAKAAVGLAGFVRQVSAAKNFSQGFQIVVAGAQRIGAQVLKALPHFGLVVLKAVRDELESIDWSKLAGAAQTAASNVLSVVGGKFRSINWAQEIARVASALGNALANGLQRLNEFLRKVNWQKVGADITKGIGLAIAAAVDFIAHLKLARITHAIVDVLGAALLAAGKILEGIGKTIGLAILKGMEEGLHSAERVLKRLADKIVLEIIEPFTHIPTGIGTPFRHLKAQLKADLAEMAADAQAASAVVTAAVDQASQAADTAAKVAHGVGLAAQAAQTAAAAETATGSTPSLPAPPTPTPPQRKGITAAQRNTFFDNEIARILLRGGLGDLRKQLAALNEASALISQRIAVTKDITRKLNLEDQLLQLSAQRRDILKQLKEQAQQQRDVRQFFLLGLGPNGEPRVPLVKTLQRQLKNVSDAIQGTFLDTKKTRSVLQHIKEVLSAGVGNVSATVRAKIKEMLDGIDQQLKDHARDLTKFAHVNSDALLAGLGLSPDQVRALRQRIAQIGRNGTVPGVRTPAFALATSSTQTTVVQIDGRTVGRAVTKHQTKEPARLPSRRG